MNNVKLCVLISWQTAHSSCVMRVFVNVICVCRLYPKQVKCGFQIQPTKLLKPFKTLAMRASL